MPKASKELEAFITKSVAIARKHGYPPVAFALAD
jgi:hypothetical protein